MKYILTSLMLLTMLATTACAKSEDEGQATAGSETGAVSAEVEAPAAEAAEAEPAENQRTSPAERFWASLGLTEEQKSELRAIRERGGTEEEMRAVLTEEQLQAIDERRGQRPDRSARLDEEQLRKRVSFKDLSEDQKAAIRARSAEKIKIIDPGTSEADAEETAEDSGEGEG